MSGELGAHVGDLVSSNLGLIPDFPEPGVLFRDITPLIANGPAFKELMEILGERYEGTIDAVAGLESRGFILGAPLATELGVGMLTIRKAGKLPGHVIGVDYALEYGTARMEIRPESVRPGSRVLVVDDVLATGGTANASVELLRRCGAEVETIAVLLELEAFNGREVLAGSGVKVESALLV
ncbi:MAG: adenine phosphoribosyltransferase [Schaalia hyovaginalis]|uniref:adenine phosphoribosyltransferase n=1 Tax=Schaalia TaxID=2529408 RepID=UPI001F40F668|nr:adenine phosphoribosyltransferase [Schaalia hyovaginalis]MCF2710281.1 adenine phosphoribosyltransferase [Schaalia hyovaginalis]MCI6412003.1 adenine phosphoribosyltransferase [Schaalia hyovaginalis]MCI6556106.1 adenine phosphoribosyltransferase [Schaalia hyovaginalis]MCI7513067.1 adenine phosphoribosyltransferase [Schaalia hyovaginalis]MDD7553702.1 adenine phosphoribosyltransferase [Schaalia hyovaginalis]